MGAFTLAHPPYPWFPWIGGQQMSVVQIWLEEGQANLDWLGLCQAFTRRTN